MRWKWKFKLRLNRLALEARLWQWAARKVEPHLEYGNHINITNSMIKGHPGQQGPTIQVGGGPERRVNGDGV